MGILFRRKKIYYLLCVLGILLICLSGDMVIINDKVYSVFRVILESPKEAAHMCDIKWAFDSGVSGWLSLLLPVTSLPFASCLSEERRSGFYLYEKGRQSSFSYLRSKICYAFASNAAILLCGMGIYILVLVCVFPINPSYGETEVIGAVGATVWGLCGHIAAKVVYLLIYGMVLSMLTGLFIYLYNDLCVDFCLVFLINYLFRRYFMGGFGL